jgi:hypothetical protein
MLSNTRHRMIEWGDCDPGRDRVQPALLRMVRRRHRRPVCTRARYDKVPESHAVSAPSAGVLPSPLSVFGRVTPFDGIMRDGVPLAEIVEQRGERRRPALDRAATEPSAFVREADTRRYFVRGSGG